MEKEDNVIPAGTKLGPYEILAPIGAGGMGEVYKAKDTRLDRTVAIKVLPSRLSNKTELKQRFEREARAVSSLNHPHICILHDVGEQDGVDYLVMEFLEGETLADRLKRGALPLSQALRYATEITDALDKAHRQGVVHRDLKPGNIMLTKSGAKLLDFGLAKLRTEVSAETSSMLSGLPTEEKPLTREGSILGTFQYMAPEQLEGKDADERTDVFAFGSVLYEILTGRKAFEGSSQASLITAIMSSEPRPVSELEPMTPPVLDWVVKRCLEKDPDERWQSAKDLTAELERIAGGNTPEVAISPDRSSRRQHLVWAAATVLVSAVAAVLAALYFSRATSQEQATVRFAVAPPENASFDTYRFFSDIPVLSPDGRRLVFPATDASGTPRLWHQSLDNLVAQSLPGTENAANPFWSADSRSIGFWAGDGKSPFNTLKRVDVSGGPPQTICEAPAAFRGGAWNREGVILFGPVPGPLYRVTSTGGTATAATTLDESREEEAHGYPQFLPDGRHFLYHAFSRNLENRGTFVGSLDSTEVRRLLPHNRLSVYAPPGYLLFVSEGTLLAQPFDADQLTTTGDPSPVASSVLTWRTQSAFSVSENGVLAYRPADPSPSQLAWFDREGRELGTVDAPEGSQGPELSPDGQKLAVERYEPGTTGRDIWLLDLSRGIASRFTFDTSDDADPIWSPDGSRIAFQSDREGHVDIYQKPAGGADDVELMLQSEARKWIWSWSPDGRHILFNGAEEVTTMDLWLLPLFGEGQPSPLLDTDFVEFGGQFSPDGRWISYTSNESGRDEVYVQPFPTLAGKWRVSNNGGSQARWRRDGKELFYIAPNRNLMAVQVASEAATFQPSTPRALFKTRVGNISGFGVRFTYAVHPDGERFLIDSKVQEPRPTPIIVVLNWMADLEK